MASEFLMPKLGLTMEEGTILEWLVEQDGIVQPGTAVMVIETDKVESEVEASAAGRLHRIGEQGQTFRCGQVIGLLLAEGEMPPQPTAPVMAPPLRTASPSAGAPAPTQPVHMPAADAGRRFVSPNARRVASEKNIDLAMVSGTGPGGRVVAADLDNIAQRSAIAWPAAATLAHSSQQSRVPATTAARQLGDLLGVDLSVVAPDPVDGYVTREAVARYVRARLQPQPPADQPEPQAAAAAPSLSQTPAAMRRMSGMRATIAKRMFASLHEMAQLTLTMDATMDAVNADRKARLSSGGAPSYTDYVIAAAARSLAIHPIVNSQIMPDGIALLPEIHVGLAVALDEGLMVPVVRHTDRCTLEELAAETTRLAHAVRAGTVTLADLEGGTFSVSSLGMFGVDGFTPVINPPNVAILGVGRLRDELTLTDGVVGVAKRMTLSLTWDHRAFDGAPAAQFCKTIVDLLADPGQLA